MSAYTRRSGRAAIGGEWLAKKLTEAGFGGPDCDFPDCTNARTPRPRGKSVKPTKYCVQHNNPRDRQIAHRARTALGKTEATRLAPVPVQQAVARAAREEQVLSSLLPRVLAALEAVHQGHRAGADVSAVAAHICEVNSAADDRVRQADDRRAEAVQHAQAALEEAARSEHAAEQARAEQQSALLEASCALGEAAAADRRAAADRAALDELAETHLRLRDAHHELTGSHRQLRDRHGEQERALSQLTGRHDRLLAAQGRLQGEKEAQDARLETLTGDNARLQEQQLRTAAELVAAQSENTGLNARLGELQTHREELWGENGRLSALLAEVRERHRREMAAALRAQSDTDRPPTALPAPAPTAAVVAERGGDVPASQTDMFGLRSTGQPALPADPIRPAPQPGAPAHSPAARSGDAGETDSRSWTLEPDPGNRDVPTSFPDGHRVGALEPFPATGQTAGQPSAAAAPTIPPPAGSSPAMTPPSRPSWPPNTAPSPHPATRRGTASSPDSTATTTVRLVPPPA
ncbi:hypothetical protein ABZX40_07350 [Streptomyces sp. NPDC004610]|uniref:hypothetical protein n=1 Tax=unclassified Streptomyces TaxID=2593676 RepID=UPI0033B2493E